MSRPLTINERLLRGEIVQVGNKLHARCADCERIIQVNKWLFGSGHICLSPEELAAKNRRRR